MNIISISETKDSLKCNGKNFFYLADTVWAAFTNISIEEWKEYLDYREKQGFNALQINILPQWDRSRINEDDNNISAFHKDLEGNIDFYSMNEDYFNKAKIMMKMAVDKGFVPALVLLWGDYIDTEWARSLKPCRVFPLEALENYIKYVMKAFSEFDPIYLVSGDVQFEFESIHPYYIKSLDIIKSINPQAITTLHIFGEESDLPEQIINSKNLDLYMYQSGHSTPSKCKKLTYELAMDFYNKSIKRPIINGEPCYEGMCHWDHVDRFKACDVRKAIWQSILSGAKAGITYGAHGVWSWHRRGNFFPGTKVFGIPFDWRTALKFKGAWDAAFAKYIFENYSLFDIEPADIIITENKNEEIRASLSKDDRTVVIYCAHNTEIKTTLNLFEYELILISLEEKLFIKPSIKMNNEQFIIEMNDYNTDFLIIGKKK